MAQDPAAGTCRTPDFPLPGARVFVAGHRGMVGSAVARRLRAARATVLTAPWPGVDLRRQDQAERWLAAAVPDAVVLAAARVGGILANATRPAEFIHYNLAIQTAVLEGARRAGVRKLVFLGSSCIYPREAAVPIAEEALRGGPCNRPTPPTRSPRSPASSSARPIAGSTAATTSPPCRATSTARATTSIRLPHT